MPGASHSLVYGGENYQWALVACWLMDDGRFFMEPPGHRDSTTPWLRCILGSQKSAESQLDRWGARGRSQAARTLERRRVRPGACSREVSDSKGQPEAQHREIPNGFQQMAGQTRDWAGSSKGQVPTTAFSRTMESAAECTVLPSCCSPKSGPVDLQAVTIPGAGIEEVLILTFACFSPAREKETVRERETE